MKRIAFYGGSFDPLHKGHLTIAEKLTDLFELDKFVFIPAFQAPHKKRQKPTPAFHRYAMLCLATNKLPQIIVSIMELEVPEKPYTIETLTKLKGELKNTEIYFVMGADSWEEITTWREWEEVLTTVNIIVVTRPNYEIGFDHITKEIRERIIDLRNSKGQRPKTKDQIFITDSVQLDISATQIRQKIRSKVGGWQKLVPEEVANYIEKYDIY